MTTPEQFPQPETDPEKHLRNEGLITIVAEYLDENDATFLDDMDDEGERIGYVYGRLLELGEDPEVILRDSGVTERGEEGEI